MSGDCACDDGGVGHWGCGAAFGGNRETIQVLYSNVYYIHAPGYEYANHLLIYVNLVHVTMKFSITIHDWL